MAFPTAFLDELRARVALADIVGKRVRLIRRGREHTGLCPFHKEKTPSFTVNEEKGFYHCFGCGKHGSVIDFVMETEGLSFPEAVERLAANVGLPLPTTLIKSMSGLPLTISALITKIESIQELLIAAATSGGADDSEYRSARQLLLGEPKLNGKLPSFLRKCRNLSQFWAFIKLEFGTYAERRKFIWDSFGPALESLEAKPLSSFDKVASEVLQRLDSNDVHSIWTRALERRETDSEGAITIARTLLETVCKLILDDSNIKYADDADLPKIYRLTADLLDLAPSIHTESAFKSILGACQTIVNTLGTLRNRIGDAHGKGRKPVKPMTRHAELAVNLAGTMASFLVSTWEDRQHRKERTAPKKEALGHESDQLR